MLSMSFASRSAGALLRSFRATCARMRALLPSIVAMTIVHSTALANPPQASAPPSDEVVVHLVTGEVLRGTLVDSTAGELVLAHAILGRLVVPQSSVARVESIPVVPPPKTVNGSLDFAAVPPDSEDLREDADRLAPPADAPAVAAGRAPRKVGDPPRPAWAAGRVDLLETDESLPPPGTVEWLLSAQAALAGVNSDDTQLDLRVAGTLTRRTWTDRWTTSAEYFLSLVDSQTTDNNLLATSVYDYYFIPTNWLAFGKLQYQYDQFQAWEHRLSGYAGFGYRIFHERPLAITIKGGFGATREFGTSDEWTPEAYGEAALAWWINSWQTLEASVNMAPSLTDFGDYRILARLDWIVRLNDQGLAFVGGLRNEYQSDVPPGSTNNDLRYYLGVRYDF